MAPLLAWLGDLAQNIMISVSSVTTTTITGGLSPNIPVGVYALTVQNPDGQQGVLSPAFTVHPCSYPTTTSEAVITFGPAALPDEGDDDHIQIIFFEVPDTAPDDLYIHIFDADTGGEHDELGLDGSLDNTVMTYTVRGDLFAYTDPDARADHPPPAGIGSGTVITQQVIGVDAALNDAWLTLPVTRTQGEAVGASRLFKLVVQGASGDDGNWYQVAISSDPANNVAVNGARIFAYSWCVVLPAPGDIITLYPFVPFGTNTVTQFNFDFDVTSGAAITLTTPLRNLSVGFPGLSGSGSVASEPVPSFDGERATTWTAWYRSGDFAPPNNDFTLWFRANGTSMAIFVAPSRVPPPP